LEDFDAVKLGSPFDYEKQVTVYIEKDLPEPNDSEFAATAVERLKKYILQTSGSAFVLFTSYSMLGEFARRMEGWLASQYIELLEQGSGIDRGVLLRKFKEDRHSVLFGTDSFFRSQCRTSRFWRAGWSRYAKRAAIHSSIISFRAQS
jgi:ATP-dependent DNA helicase DinG